MPVYKRVRADLRACVRALRADRAPISPRCVPSALARTAARLRAFRGRRLLICSIIWVGTRRAMSGFVCVCVNAARGYWSDDVFAEMCRAYVADTGAKLTTGC